MNYSGSYTIIDLDLSRYDQLAMRFQRQKLDDISFLKSGIQTRNKDFNKLIEQIETVAVRSPDPILLTGPTGAGKSLLARRIYELKKEHNQVTGNFVEIKKSRIATGSKVNHLSYIGDTLMGSKVNIGAGTIVCNYDGAYKHLTEIGDNVFVGSDTQLIAPVKVGNGATIGAGSTITRDVPADELTLSRSVQKTRPGWKRPVKKET